MLESLQIENFRGLRNLNVDDMSRINIFAGANGSGKTSLNEALSLLLSSDSEFLLDASILRRSSVLIEGCSATYDALWRPLYFNSDTTLPIRVSAFDTLHGRINAELTSARSTKVVRQDRQESVLGEGAESLELKVYEEGNLIRESSLELSGQKIRATGTIGPLLGSESTAE